MKSYKILIACVSGMSTSILVHQMRKVAAKYDYKIEITYAAQLDIEEEARGKDIVLLGPQLRTAKNRFTKLLADTNTPVVAVPIQYFADMDGEKVLQFAINSIEQSSL